MPMRVYFDSTQVCFIEIILVKSSLPEVSLCYWFDIPFLVFMFLRCFANFCCEWCYSEIQCPVVIFLLIVLVSSEFIEASKSHTVLWN